MKRLIAGRRRRAAASIEMAIVLPLFILIVLGIVEFGRALMVNQILVNAAREGGRRAVIPGATDAEVNGIVDGHMNSAGITGFTRTLAVNGTVASLATAKSHDEITVSVSVNHNQVSWGIMNLIAPNRKFVGRVVIKKE